MFSSSSFESTVLLCAKAGLPSSSSSSAGERARRGGVLTVGMKGDRVRDLRLMRRTGEGDLERDLELSVEGDLDDRLLLGLGDLVLDLDLDLEYDLDLLRDRERLREYDLLFLRGERE